MSHIKFSNHGSTPFEKLMGHNPEILQQWGELERTLFQSKNFKPDFLEQIRRALAFDNVCLYCMAKAGPPDENPSTLQLAEALRFANKFAIDHKSITKQEIDRLKNHFSDSELIELVAFCTFVCASQRFGASLGLQPLNYYEEN